MNIKISYDPDSEIDSAAAHLLGQEILTSDQFDLESDTLLIEPQCICELHGGVFCNGCPVHDT